MMLITQSDEEANNSTGNKETIHYMCKKSKGAEFFLNLEPCAWKNGITLERKVICQYKFTINGVSEHLSLCYNGTSAIAEVAQKILQLEKFKDKDGITFIA